MKRADAYAAYAEEHLVDDDTEPLGVVEIGPHEDPSDPDSLETGAWVHVRMWVPSCCVPPLLPGDRVIWTDPDGGQEVAGSVSRLNGEVLTISSDDGSEIETYIDEIRRVK